jgi:hypothetical protein
VYFFNILNTTDPEYVSSLVKHAQSLRFGDQGKQAERNIIEVTDKWIEEL